MDPCPSWKLSLTMVNKEHSVLKEGVQESTMAMNDRDERALFFFSPSSFLPHNLAIFILLNLCYPMTFIYSQILTSKWKTNSNVNALHSKWDPSAWWRVRELKFDGNLLVLEHFSHQIQKNIGKKRFVRWFIYLFKMLFWRCRLWWKRHYI